MEAAAEVAHPRILSVISTFLIFSSVILTGTEPSSLAHPLLSYSMISSPLQIGLNLSHFMKRESAEYYESTVAHAAPAAPPNQG